MPPLFAVFGNPIAHSLSPRIHALFAQQCHLPLRYETRCPPLDGFADALHAFVREGGQGANITVPFKEAAFALAHRSSARALRAGAANTLTFSAQGWHADNTDGIGLVRDLAFLCCPLAGQRVLLLGAGGAARGIIQPLRDAGVAHILVANRSPDKAAALAAAFADSGPRVSHCALATLAESAPMAGTQHEEPFALSFDLIINATASGLANSVLPLPDTLFVPEVFAYDMLYGKRTSFLRQAQAQGARTADGLGMLIEQAAAAFTLWHGITPDTVAVRHALHAEIMR